MEQLVFIGGMTRSGINLLRSMIDSHADIAAGPALNNIENIAQVLVELSESHARGNLATYLSENELTALQQGIIEGLLRPYAAQKGKKIAVASSFNTLWAFPVLAQLFPTAKFIHVVRDGRDVATSNREVASRLAAQGRPDTANTSSIFHTASMWRESVALGQSICGPQSELSLTGRAITVRYEDLTMSPLFELQRICRVLGVQFDQRMLAPQESAHDNQVDGAWIIETNINRPVSTDSIGRWLRDLSFRDRMLFMAAGQDTLTSLRYELDSDWAFRNLTISQEDMMLEIELVNEELAAYEASEAAKNADADHGSLKVEKVVIDTATEARRGTLPASRLTASAQQPSNSTLPLRR